MKQRETVPCAYCGRTGEVYKFADGRLPKGSATTPTCTPSTPSRSLPASRSPNPLTTTSGIEARYYAADRNQILGQNLAKSYRGTYRFFPWYDFAPRL
jgi:hypothetical protein